MKNKTYKSRFFIATLCCYAFFGQISLYAQNFVPNFFSTDGEIQAIKIEGCDLYVGGYFQWIGLSVNKIAQISLNNDIPNYHFPDFSATIGVQLSSIISDNMGGWYVLGEFNKVNDIPKNNLVHILSDLSVDMNFSPPDFVSNSIFNQLILDNGLLYISGKYGYTNNSIVNLSRINAITGEPDTTWKPNPNEEVKACEIWNDYIFVRGNFSRIGGKLQNRLASVSKTSGLYLPFLGSSKGVNDMAIKGDTLFIASMNNSTFGVEAYKNTVLSTTMDLPQTDFPFMFDQVNGVFPDGNGGWYVASVFSSLGGVQTKHIARFNADLTINQNFIQSNTLQGAYSLHVVDKYVYVATNSNANIQGVQINNLIRIDTATGAIDTSFHPNPNGKINIIYANDTAIFIGGLFTEVDGQPRNRIAAFNRISGELLNWNPNIVDTDNKGVSKILEHNNHLYVAGGFSHIGDSVRYLLAEFDGSGNLTNTNLNLNYFWLHGISDMVAKDSLLYFSGNFSLNYKGVFKSNFAVFNLIKDKIADFNLSIYPSNPTNALLSLSGDTLFFAATFDSINGQYRKHIAALNTANGNLYNWAPNPDAQVYVMAAKNGQLYLSGGFNYLKHITSGFCMLDLNNFTAKDFLRIRYYDHYVNDIECKGDTLFIAGRFQNVNDSTRYQLAAVDANTAQLLTWQPPVVTPLYWSSTIYKAKVLNNTLIITGDFTNLNGQSRNGLAAIDLLTGNLKSWNPMLNSDIRHEFTVRDIGIYDTNIVIVGDFTQLKSHKRNNIAKINMCTNEISPWAPEVNNHVNTIEISGDTCFIGGNFSTINGVTYNALAALDKNAGGAFPTWKPEPNATVKVIKKYEDKLYVGGDFTSIGGQNIPRFAQLNMNNGTPTSWNPNITYATIGDIYCTPDYVFVGGSGITYNNENYNLLQYDRQTASLIRHWKNTDSIFNVISLTGFDSTLIWGTYYGSYSNYNTINAINIHTGYTIPDWKPFFPSQVNAIKYENSIVYAAGGYFVNTQYSALKAWSPYDDSTLFELPLLFNNDSRRINTFDFSGNKVVLGGYFQQLGNIKKVSCLAMYQLPNIDLHSKISSYTPKSKGNEGFLKMQINGYGFTPQTTAKLYRTGQPDIVAEIVNVNSHQFNISFDVHNVTTGLWNLEVNIPNDTIFHLIDAINIEAKQEPVLWADLIGPSIVTKNQPTKYYVVFGNTSNVDAIGVPLLIAVDKNNMSLSLNFYPSGIPDDSLTPIDYDTIPKFFTTDTLMGKLFSAKVYPLWFPVIKANSSMVFPVIISNNSITTSQAKVYIGNSTMEHKLSKSTSYLGLLPEVVDCIVEAITLGVEMAPIVGCIQSGLENLMEPVVEASYGVASDEALYYTDIVSKIIMDCVPGGAAKNKLVKSLVKMYEKTGDFQSTVSTAKACHEFLDKFNDELYRFIEPFWSQDPNNKYGPTSLGGSHYVGNNNIFNYAITFENDDSALVAAKIVNVIDTLDTNVFDISTFTLKSFGFGDTILIAPPDLQNYNIDVDLRPAKNVIVRIEASLDETKGIAKWTYTSLDPQTMMLTENVFGGFLPPNTTAPEGEGAVVFSINLKEGVLASGLTVSNKASIIFDWNEPIFTPTWTNTIDLTIPQSNILPLQPVYYDTSFPLKIAANDVGSGAFSYDIYVAVNDGNYYRWKNTFNTTEIFKGMVDSTYQFYSIAKDSAGNIEEAPLTYDATTRIEGVSIPEIIGDNGHVILYQNIPNPANNTTLITYFIPKESHIKLELLDVLGRTLQVFENKTIIAGHYKHQIDCKDFNAGAYFYRLSVDGITYLKRMIITK
ncbi:MAG: hypothetical protein BWY27_00207 [Bacteroidetes bacterium ADurb.Bin234]|jgi:hypothetical protein|nr:MAG: hypothetical protein BWY27_00207 [Bacteroidetes bacterium ADurb.Bin234]